MSLEQNQGARPSKLALSRFAAGELTGAEETTVENWMTANPGPTATHQEALASARALLTPFDPAAIRTRADSLQHLGLELGVNRSGSSAWVGWARWVAPLAIAALVFLAVNIPHPNPVGTDGVVAGTPAFSVKGGDQLLAFHAENDGLIPYDGRALGESDTLGFRVRTGAFERASLMSIDGLGAVTVFLGADAPINLTSDPMMDLPGTVILDNAPGPELFIVVFDEEPDQVADRLREAWLSGGTSAVEEMVAAADHLDAVVVNRK